MQNLLGTKIATACLLLLTLWLGFSVLDGIRQRQMALRQMQDLQGRITALENDNTTLAHLKDYYQTSAYLDRQARLKLNYKAADEKVVFVYPASPPGVAAAPVTEDIIANLKKWWHYLLHP